ncbi:MAG: tetratricopeptide repeat protein [Rhodocyclales bacterium]|nr:tetratricopeptide repeat protein [Rhodocyclales bacterium]
MPLPNWRRLPDADRRAFTLLALAWLAGLAAYGNGLAGVFQFDDYQVIVDAGRVHTLAAWWQATSHGGLRPLLNLTYTLNWIAGDGSPLVFHACNLLLHLVATACVFSLARSFLHRRASGIDGDLVAAWAALLFAVHPLHSEAVTYVSGRSTSLMTVFYLGALVYYARAEEGRLRHRLAALGLSVLAVLSKETALLFPLALVAWDWSAGTPWRIALRRQWPFWLLFLLLLLAVLQHPGYWSLLEQSLDARDLARGPAPQLHAAAVLLGRLFWPAALNIDPDWPLPGPGDVLPEALLFAAGALLALGLRRQRPWLALAVIWLLIHLLLPHLLFPRTDIANERQMFWADWPIFLCVAVEIQRHLKPAFAWTIVLVCAGLLAATAIHRNELYRSELALWQDTARHSPNKARVFNNLGYALQSTGRTDEARAAYRRALALDPLHLKAANNLERLDR